MGIAGEMRISDIRCMVPAAGEGAGGRADKSVRAARVLVIFQGSGAAGEKRVPLRLRCFGMTLLLLKLLAADGEAVDADGGGGDGAAEFQIVSDFGNIQEHVFQVSG